MLLARCGGSFGAGNYAMAGQLGRIGPKRHLSQMTLRTHVRNPLESFNICLIDSTRRCSLMLQVTRDLCDGFELDTISQKHKTW